VVRRFEEVPGIGWIRALTFYVLIDTPERFTKSRSVETAVWVGEEQKRQAVGRLRVCKEGIGCSKAF